MKKLFEVFFLLVISSLLVTAQAMGQELELGNPAPFITPYEWVTGDPIEGYEDGKVYIIEMGATWCKPCAKAIPELTEIAKEYKDKVEVVSFFVQEVNFENSTDEEPPYIQKVRNYVKKRHSDINYTIGVDGPDKTIEKGWINAFGKGRGLPQTFVLDKKGRIAAHFKGFTVESLKNVLDGVLAGSYEVDKQTALEEVSYDRFKPLFVDNNGGSGDDFVYRSLITEYKGVPRVGRSYSYIRSWRESQLDSVRFKDYLGRIGRLELIGASMSQLYYAAYSDTTSYKAESRHPVTEEYPDYDSIWWFADSYGAYWSEPILEVSEEYRKHFDWSYESNENRWIYTLSIPPEKASAGYLQKLLQNDLNRFFGYEVRVEEREMPCWFLKVDKSTQDIIDKNPESHGRAIGGQGENGERIVHNADIRDIINLLARKYSKGPNYSLRNPFPEPFIDKTGLSDYRIRYRWTLEEREAFYENRDFDVAKSWLKRNGLYLEKGKKKMKVVVIRDPKNDNS